MKAIRRLWCAGIVMALAAGTALAGEGGGPAAAPASDSNAAAPAALYQQVAEQIAASIAASVPQQGYAVEVLYSAGTATLRGRVANAAQLQQILAAVGRHPAVKQIYNGLVIGSQPAVQPTGFQQQGQQAPPEKEPAEPSRLEPSAPAAAPTSVAPPAPQHVFTRAQGLQYDWPYMPGFSWPAYAPYPNFSAVQYPRCYSAQAWPYIGPFYPYPEPPLDWRSVKLKYFAGHWYLRFHKPMYLLRSIRYYY